VTTVSFCGNFEVYVLQIVLARTAHHYLFQHRKPK